ncbi:MAG: alpha/beta fold hydrolase [Geodermatophilaceae bacterium]|nr:alpha/beta fold hydrolase [Geodermatophilaceae bacterium]
MVKNPMGTAAAHARLVVGMAAAVRATAGRAIGRPSEGPASPVRGDKRFADPAYAENPLYFLLEQQYLLAAQLVTELLDAAGLEAAQDVKSRFAAKFIVDALAPTNLLPGNPAAMRAAFDTGGKSVLRGARNMLGDIRHNGGWPSQVDASGFEVGVNMAATPGSVVYRSDLIEVIQYEPQVAKVHAVPLLFCPPWINKYYIMDLAPGKSLIEWAVQHGHTCFAISYRNPDASMRDLGFEDYLRQGPLDAVRVVREITGAPEVNVLSVCLGGTLTAIALAHNAGTGDRSIKSATFLNTLTDFSSPGALGTFTDEATIAGLEKQMAKKGYLDSDKMAHTFDALRANDLVFGYVVNNWLLGKKPPAFDLLVWNKDSTRMPAKMHSEYLRSCYLNNEFSGGEFEIDGQKLDPGKVDVDTYVLSAVDDHIVPWVAGYKTTQLFGGHNRYVLSTSGHIAGIVNPPGPKAKHWTNDALPSDPQEWKDGATLHESTWWDDWTTWIAGQGGPKVPAPRRLGSKAHPPIEAAPGSYVRTRA